MQRERCVQLIAGLVTLGALGASVTLIPTIKEQRRDLRPNVDLAGLPPDYALTTTALGPFRGLFVDWLWYRAEMMKRDGKIYEVNTLASWITTLQPRFPQVWRFHAWNLAYNISVKTDTPEERWRWVQKGIRLLRREGIPQNPKSLGLHRELAMIFWHKIGLTADDMHGHYKHQLAKRWHRILGGLSSGVDQQTAVNRMQSIARMAERYFKDNEPPAAQRAALNKLAKQFPDYANRLNELKTARISDLVPKLRQYQQQWQDERPELAKQLTPIRNALVDHPVLTGQGRVALLQQQHPGTAPILGELRSADIQFNTAGLKTIGDVLMKMDLLSPGVVDQNLAHGPGRHGKEVLAVLPVHGVMIYQLQVRLVHELRRAKRVRLPLSSELVVRDAAQLVVHGWEEVVQDRLVPVAQLPEQGRYVRLGITHSVYRSTIIRWG